MFNKRAGGFYWGIKPLGLARWLYAPIEPDPRVYRAVASFFVTGGIMANAGGTSLVGGVGGILPQRIFKFGGSKTLFSALVMRYVSETSTASKCKKAGVFSAYK